MKKQIKNSIIVNKKTYLRMSEKEFEASPDEEESLWLILIEFDGEPVAFFRRQTK